MTPGSGTEPGFADSVDAMVSALEQDPVLVEEIMGNGNTAALHEALSAKAAHSPVPVHVVLTKAPAGLTTQNTAEELLTLLHAKSGEDGVWVVSTSDVGHVETAVFGDIDPAVDDDETNISSAVSQALEEVRTETRDACSDCHPSPAVEAGLVLDVLAHGVPERFGDNPVTSEQVDSYVTSTWWEQQTQTAYYDRAEMPSDGLYAVVATVTALVVAVVSYRLVQAIGGTANPRLAGAGARVGDGPGAGAGAGDRQRPTPDPQVELQRWTSRAGSEVRSLATALERAGEVDAGRREVASACLERAEPRVGSDDLLEVIGAVVLARTGKHALKRRQGQYRCCYVDPRHGAADTEAPLGGGVEVPVCRTCAAALAKGTGLEPLTEPVRFGRRRPYYEGSTVWAEHGFGALGGEWWHDVPRAAGGLT